MYAKSEYPTADKLVSKMKEAENCRGTGGRAILRIMKDMSFKYQKANEGKKLLIERSDIVAAKTVFLRTMHEIRKSGTS